MQKSFLKKKKRPNGDMALQITSMADIFMILLVFLLKNYSASVANMGPAKDTRLPIAEASTSVEETLKIEIASDSVLVDEKQIIALKNFAYPDGEAVPAGAKDKLTAALLEERSKHPDRKDDAHIMLIADEKAPYETIQRVLASAASSGFVDLQLVVVAKE
jgi:biopolymer transport protein ExbD